MRCKEVLEGDECDDAMMDVSTDEQELPEPVKLRAICEVSDEWEKLGRIRHQRATYA